MAEPGEEEQIAKQKYSEQVKDAYARLAAAWPHFSTESEGDAAEKESVIESLQGLRDTALWYIDNAEKEITCKQLKIAASNTISKLEYIVGTPLPDASSPRVWSLSFLGLEDFNRSVAQFETQAKSIFERRFDKADWKPAHQPARAPPRLFISKLHSTQDRLIPSQGLGKWINLAHIRRWMSLCQQHHPSHCNLSLKSKALFPYKPQWLIDVSQKCLVQADAHTRYLALSYVWGTSKPFSTCRQNIAELQQANSLAAVSALGISPTVSHAMQLTKGLGESYLWVDTLCIVQDDDADKREHLDNMGSIYANALASIVAASGTAEEGLYGLENATPLSKPLCRSENPNAKSQHMAHARLRQAHQSMMKSAWSSRGWTFQEQIFSRRLIVMSQANAIWECHCSVWFEDDDADGTERCNADTHVVADGFSFNVKPKFYEYKLHAVRVNKSDLTFPEDIMDSFAGVLTVLSKTFTGGFWCCLPVLFLDRALLWYGRYPMTRRHPTKADARMPATWSWAAWEGQIDFPPECDIVVPLVKWKYCGPESKGKWWDTKSGSAVADEKAQDASATTLATDSTLFSTEADPPVPGNGERYLIYSRAQRIYVNAADCFESQIVPVEDKAGKGLGMVRSNVTVEISKSMKLQIEVVAISEMVVAKVNTYNVLWIDRDDFGIAHRRGVGRILKSDWDAQKPEEIVLILG